MARVKVTIIGDASRTKINELQIVAVKRLSLRPNNKAHSLSCGQVELSQRSGDPVAVKSG